MMATVHMTSVPRVRRCADVWVLVDRTIRSDRVAALLPHASTAAKKNRRFAALLRWTPDRLPLRCAPFQASGEGPRRDRAEPNSAPDASTRWRMPQQLFPGAVERRGTEPGTQRPNSPRSGACFFSGPARFARCRCAAALLRWVPDRRPLRCAPFQASGKGLLTQTVILADPALTRNGQPPGPAV